jgi:hypothetical protein
MVKTDRNSVFFYCKAHIIDRLHIMVPLISFYGFSKISNFGSDPKGLAFNFTEKRQFASKTDENFIFLGHEAHILDRLHIMVLYIRFYMF